MNKNEDVYILRANDENNQSYGGFQWSKKGVVTAPDWDPDLVCGGGLHGFLSGVGDVALIPDHADLWLVCRVIGDVIDLGGKVKFKSCEVLFCGDRDLAVKIIKEKTGAAVMFGTATAGDGGMATAGDHGTATAGYYGMATAGDGGMATAGYYGMATAGDGGMATAGDHGTATAGYYGMATAGDGGTATAGDGGTAAAGDGGIILIKYYDGDRYRILIGYVGEGGIKKNTSYIVDDGIFMTL